MIWDIITALIAEPLNFVFGLLPVDPFIGYQTIPDLLQSVFDSLGYFDFLIPVDTLIQILQLSVAVFIAELVARISLAIARFIMPAMLWARIGPLLGSFLPEMFFTIDMRSGSADRIKIRDNTF